MKKLLLLLLLAPCAASAATDLAVTCQSPAAEGVQVNSLPAGCSVITLRTPLATDLVRVDPSRIVGSGANWELATFKWKTWSKLVAGETYEACKSDVPEGTTNIALCTNWKFVAKAAVVAGTNKVTLTWLPPTQYTDGTAISEPLTFNVYRGSTEASMPLLKAGAVSPYADLVAPGTYFYAVTAVGKDAESDKSASQSTTVTPPKLVPGPPKTVTVTISVTVP